MGGPTEGRHLKLWTCSSLEGGSELVKTHNFECRVPKCKEVRSPWLLNNVTTKSRDEFSMIKGLAFMTDAPMIEPYEQAGENRKKWFEDKQE